MWFMDIIKEAVSLKISIKKILLLFLIGCAAGILLLVLPAIVDSQEMHYQVEISSEKLEEQGEYPHVAIEDNPYFVLDNFSESIILNCIYNANAENVWEDTLAQKRFRISEEELTNLRVLATGGSAEYGEDSFRQMLPYWMGCRSFLRLLLNVMDYMTIRGLMQVLVGALLVTAIVLAAGRIDQRFALFLGLSAIMMNLQVASSVMAQAAMFVIVFLNVIILTRSQSKKWWSYLFFLIGMVSVYFDWFTFPVITYCVPMLSVLCMEWKENAGDRKAGYYMHLIFEKGVLWCLGYGLMLLSKTAVSTVFAGKSALAYFLGRVTTNAGMVAGNEESAISMTAKALIKCFNGILPLTFVGRKMLAVIVVLVLILVIVQVYRRKSWLMDGCIAFVGIGVPILWIVAFHHFYKVHYWFGYRVLFGTVLAILLLIGRKEEMKE